MGLSRKNPQIILPIVPKVDTIMTNNSGWMKPVSLGMAEKKLAGWNMEALRVA
jgi:hypothetical protein